MKHIHLIYILFIGIFLASCSSDDGNTDTTAPKITIVEPHEDEIFDAGTIMHVEIIFSDNVELASYKIDIHHAGDGHGHGRGGETEWDYETEGSLFGKNYTLHLEIAIPEDAEEGEYHFGVFALDTSGNETVVWSEIIIESH